MGYGTGRAGAGHRTRVDSQSTKTRCYARPDVLRERLCFVNIFVNKELLMLRLDHLRDVRGPTLVLVADVLRCPSMAVRASFGLHEDGVIGGPLGPRLLPGPSSRGHGVVLLLTGE